MRKSIDWMPGLFALGEQTDQIAQLSLHFLSGQPEQSGETLIGSKGRE